jgi:hypothetical protein
LQFLGEAPDAVKFAKSVAGDIGDALIGRGRRIEQAAQVLNFGHGLAH